MAMDKDTVRKVARLARLEMDEAGVERTAAQLSGILQWIEQLGEVNTDGVEPLANVAHIKLKLRPDAVTDGGDALKVLSNAPEKILLGSEDQSAGFYVVPKVVE